jgi:hypothetical protein
MVTATDPVAERGTGADLTRVVTALLLIGLYYNWYRYPFQINSTDTSPTYSDTPMWLSLGKYGVIAVVIGFALLARALHRDPVRISSPTLTLAFAYLAVIPLAGGVFLLEPDLAQIGVFFLVPLILAGFQGWRVSAAEINRVLAVGIYLAITVQLLQVVLFFTAGRLPALAYAETISIRFGSFLDDPNGFGLLIVWMLPFTWSYFSRTRAVALTALLLVCLVLTQSLTAAATVLLVSVVFLGLAISGGGRPLLVSLGAIGTATAVGGALAYRFRDPLAALYSVFLLSKEGSITGHGASLEMLRSLRVLNLTGFEPAADAWGESGYGNFVAFFGVLYLIVFLGVVVVAAVTYDRLFRDPRTDYETRAFAGAAFGYLVGICAASINLPTAEIFPLNLFTALLVGLASAGLIFVEEHHHGRSRNAAGDRTTEPVREAALTGSYF